MTKMWVLQTLLPELSPCSGLSQGQKTAGAEPSQDGSWVSAAKIQALPGLFPSQLSVYELFSNQWWFLSRDQVAK